MQKTGIGALLVIGIDSAAVAKSAKEAGYRVHAVDFFGDVDLRRACVSCKSIVEQKHGHSHGKMELKFESEKFLKMAKMLLKEQEIGAILLSSGLDDHFEVLDELNDIVPILGNSPKVIRKVREKNSFFEELKHLDIKHPETVIVKNVSEASAAAKEMGFPVVFKPTRGFGGAGATTVHDSQEVGKAFRRASLVSEDVLVQKFINGTHTSVSLIATDDEVEVLTVNEQLLGLQFLYQQEPLGYCGNIVPLSCSGAARKQCEQIAEKVAFHFGLNGSNGIDLIISNDDNPYVVEVNPRFQGTLECVEKVLGINLVEAHINACLRGFLPPMKKRASIYCTRLILYAPRRVVAPDLTVFSEVRDIPFPETMIEKREPVCSVLTEESSRDASFQRAEKIAKSIYDMLRPA